MRFGGCRRHHLSVADRQVDLASSVHGRIVSGDEQCRPGSGVQFDQEVEDRLAGRGVEVSGGLIGEQQRRIDNECPCDGNPLLFASGQL